MNCRQCGTPIPSAYLKRDSFQCPKCGKLYRRRPSQTVSNPSSMKVRHPKTSKGIKAFLTRKVWKLPMWAVILIALFLIGSISNIGGSDQPAQTQASEPAEIAVKIAPFSIDGSSLGEYGKNLSFGTGTESEYSFVGYFVPAGQYVVKNNNTASVQITIYAEGSTVEDGVEYPLSGQQSPVVIMPNTTAEVNVLEGEYIKLSDGNNNTYWETK